MISVRQPWRRISCSERSVSNAKLGAEASRGRPAADDAAAVERLVLVRVQIFVQLQWNPEPNKVLFRGLPFRRSVAERQQFQSE